MPEFRNESTFKSYVEENRLEEFDSAFDDAVAAARKEAIGKEHMLYINGKPVNASAKITEYSPIDGSVIGIFQKAGREETRASIDAALAAFGSWGTMDYRDRVEIFNKAADIFSKKKFELAAILSMENGKTRYESIGEVDEAIDFMRYYSMEMLRNKGFIRKRSAVGSQAKVNAGFQGAPGSGEKVSIVLRPYGVFGIIAPFNFPVSISVGMCVGALITGNAIVFKPSSTDNMTMLTGLKIYELLRSAGLPDGVMNYITGPGSEVGDELVMNSKVSGIAFTGSRRTGMSMMAKSLSAGLQKTFVVEMGGKNPVIVSRYAELEKAAKGVAGAAFGFSGQKCSAASRVYVHESKKEEFISKLLDNVRQLKIGDPLQKENYIGPLISKAALDKYTESVAEAGSAGRVVHGGNAVSVNARGIYVEPVVAELDHGNRLFHEELFVPFLVIDTYKDFSEALAKANDTDYGLTAGLYSKKKSEIREFIGRMQSGVLYVNREVSATTGAIVGLHTFVGWKGSGLTGKGTGSRQYLQQFMHEQSQSIVK